MPIDAKFYKIKKLHIFHTFSKKISISCKIVRSYTIATISVHNAYMHVAVHIIILYFYSLTFVLSPSAFSLPLPLPLNRNSTTHHRTELGVQYFFFLSIPSPNSQIETQKTIFSFKTQKHKRFHCFLLHRNRNNNRCFNLKLISSGRISILSPRKFSSRSSMFFFLFPSS